ncbi:MAG TPA: hypothetical protein PKD51_14675 [Saprospiraceae bacterium]|nr:hypothetical protein [Saprospiraceae bacterium]
MVFINVTNPVGKDQEQHLELSRNIANRFNNKYGKIFNEPSALFTNVTKLMSLADPSKKMSKSLGDKHYIGIYEDELSIRTKVKNAVTCSEVNEKMPDSVSNLIQILIACQKDEQAIQFKKDYAENSIKYSQLKMCVSDALVELSMEFKYRKSLINRDDIFLKNILKRSADKCRTLASQTLAEVKKCTGLNYV